MKVSGIARLNRAYPSAVDPISWYESARRVQPIQPEEKIYRKDFHKVMKELEEGAILRKLRVVEIVFAPGVRPGIHWIGD